MDIAKEFRGLGYAEEGADIFSLPDLCFLVKYMGKSNWKKKTLGVELGLHEFGYENGHGQ